VPESNQTRVVSLPRAQGNLYPGGVRRGLLKELLDETAATRQGTGEGEKEPPFDFEKVQALMTANPHHSTCIHTKVSSTVGLGFETPADKNRRQQAMEAQMQPPPPPASPAGEEVEKASDPYEIARADEVLNPLCSVSWADVLHDVCEDYMVTGNGYIEVVRSGGTITGLHHIPANDLRVKVEAESYNSHYILRNSDTGIGSNTIGEQVFARFNDKDRVVSELDQDPDLVSEVIHLRRPSSMSRYYGSPDWIAAVPSIELVQMLMQFRYDFFLNRGVPEFFLFVTGQNLTEDEWEKIETAMQATIGLGQSHKSVALNIPNPDVNVVLERLGIEGKSDDTLADTKENLAMDIVTAHRVPPLLAGIQIPGKLGATNELPNALMAFQLLVIGPHQRIFHQTLGSTLGGEGGVGGLTMDDFTFRRITDEIDLGKMDTVARMRQSPMQANEEGRDLNDGVRD
jgi:PBSX family phage portal protein